MGLDYLAWLGKSQHHGVGGQVELVVCPQMDWFVRVGDAEAGRQVGKEWPGEDGRPAVKVCAGSGFGRELGSTELTEVSRTETAHNKDFCSRHAPHPVTASPKNCRPASPHNRELSSSQSDRVLYAILLAR
jgi:hypothetical protein